MALAEITMDRTFPVSVEKLWRALTDRGEMQKWYFDLAEFKPEVGFKFEFAGGPAPDRQYTHLCEVTEVILHKKLTYSWKYKGYDGISYVTFELIGQGDHTLLKFSHTGLDSFPADNADLAAENFSKGWNHIIHKSLKEYSEKLAS
jgi:uncharacterized protein YndB with AHSA1/START domain